MTGMSVYILYLDTKTKNQEDGTDWNNTRISCCPVTSDERTNVVAVKYARLSHWAWLQKVCSSASLSTYAKLDEGCDLQEEEEDLARYMHTVWAWYLCLPGWPENDEWMIWQNLSWKKGKNERMELDRQLRNQLQACNSRRILSYSSKTKQWQCSSLVGKTHAYKKKDIAVFWPRFVVNVTAAKLAYKI